jgi:hypothetical protein
MLATVRALAALLAGDPLTVDEVIAQLGAVAHDYGANVVVTPRDPAFGEASVVRGLDPTTARPSSAPAHVELTLVEPRPIEALADAFGTYREIPAEEKTPRQAIFSLDLPDRPRQVVLIAHLRQGRVVRIVLRRD